MLVFVKNNVFFIPYFRTFFPYPPSFPPLFFSSPTLLSLFFIRPHFYLLSSFHFFLPLFFLSSIHPFLIFVQTLSVPSDLPSFPLVSLAPFLLIFPLCSSSVNLLKPTSLPSLYSGTLSFLPSVFFNHTFIKELTLSLHFIELYLSALLFIGLHVTVWNYPKPGLTFSFLVKVIVVMHCSWQQMWFPERFPWIEMSRRFHYNTI